MPLRDRLIVLRDQQQRGYQARQDRPGQIAEWVGVADALFAEIRGYLAEYEADGSLSIAITPMYLEEEYFGEYQVNAMTIDAGSVQIDIRPVGRFIVGAQGRVDMHRHGRASEDQRIMLLRAPASKTDQALVWFLRMPFEPGQPTGLMTPRQSLRLSKDSLKPAIELLLS